MSKSICVVYHSGYGHTAKVAEAVAAGVAEAGAKAQLCRIDADGNLPDAVWAELDQADAIIFGTPTYMGGPSWQFKKFADASAKRWFGQTWLNKVAAGFTNSGSASGDKLATLYQLFTLAMQHSMIWVGFDKMPPQPKGTATPSLDDVNRIGSYSGLMTQSNNESPEIVPPKGDIESARLFGQRVARATTGIAVV
jgi:NAD(P)H dehydrogenase (quinone)